MPSSKLYTYASGDILANPNSYTYTAFKGREFLDEYLASRQEVLLYLKEGADQNTNISGIVAGLVERMPGNFIGDFELFACADCLEDYEGIKFSNIVKEEQVDTAEVFNQLLLARAHGLQIAAHEEILRKFRSKIEIQKLIYEGYDSKFRRAFGNFRNMDLYAALAALLASSIVAIDEIAWLNSLLKCNDVLAAHCKEGISSGGKKYALFAFIVEINLVKLILKNV